uniref:Uncharacterized protein n=1 Tax=Solanum tuberosum TaxID=4113 RepID=M1DEJ0_SOLTU
MHICEEFWLYAQYTGLCTKEDYPNIGFRPEDAFIPPVPTQALKYRIGHITRVRTEDSNADRVNLEEENLVTDEELKEILRRQPIIGAIRLFQSFHGKGMDDKAYHTQYL